MKPASFPKLLPGYVQAIEPMLDRTSEVLRGRDVAKLSVWAHTALPGSFDWLETRGYVEHADYPKGYKKYVTYDPARGPLEIPHSAEKADEKRDREDIAYAVSIWSNCSP